MKYLIAYDICDPRRLRRVARVLEKHAVRCQKSVFVFQGEADNLAPLLNELAQLILPAEDVVQAWRLAPGETPRGVHRGTAPVAFPAAAVLGPQRMRCVSLIRSPRNEETGS